MQYSVQFDIMMEEKTTRMRVGNRHGKDSVNERDAITES